MLYRVHEWIADRVRFVQYPRLRRVVPQQPRWGSGFSLLTKVGLAFLGLPLVVLGAAIILGCLWFLWALVSALIAT